MTTYSFWHLRWREINAEMRALGATKLRATGAFRLPCGCVIDRSFGYWFSVTECTQHAAKSEMRRARRLADRRARFVDRASASLFGLAIVSSLVLLLTILGIPVVSVWFPAVERVAWLLQISTVGIAVGLFGAFIVMAFDRRET